MMEELKALKWITLYNYIVINLVGKQVTAENTSFKMRQVMLRQ